jgi:hypothetical protein
MPRVHLEAILFCLAWAALALAGGLWASWWIGALLSVGLLVLISVASMRVLSQTNDLTMERQARWGILIVAALALLVYLNLYSSSSS